MARSRDYNINPPHNIVRQESPDVIRARMFDHHHRAGTLDTYYHVYDGDRPASRDRNEAGRGR